MPKLNSYTPGQNVQMDQEGNSAELEKPFQCTICNLRFTTNAAKNIHGKSHKTREKLVCKECGFTTTEFLLFRKHRLDSCAIQKYHCHKCKMKFSTIMELNEHMSKGHLNEDIQCTDCNFTTKSLRGLSRHRTIKHPPEEEDVDFACAECDYISSSKAKMTQHIALNHTFDDEYDDDDEDYIGGPSSPLGNDAFTCPICDYSDPDAYNMEMHIQEFHEVNKPFACTECDFECYDDEQLELHMLSDHGEDTCNQSGYTVVVSAPELKMQMLTCTLCPYTCPSKENLEHHVFKVHTDHEENTNVVSEYNSGNNISKRGRINADEERNKSAVSQSIIGSISKRGRQLKPRKYFDESDEDSSNDIRDDYKRHVDNKRAEWKRQIDDKKEKIYKNIGMDCKCHICGQYFVNKSGLKQHMSLKHENNECEDCDIIFKTAVGLKNHMIKVHSYSQQFSCSKCDYICNTELDLRSHMSVHETKRQFSCIECEDSFDDKVALMNHMLSMNHTGGKPHRCTKCKAQFLTNAALNIHMETHNSDTPYREEPLEDSETVEFGTDIRYDPDFIDNSENIDDPGSIVHDSVSNYQSINITEASHTFDHDDDDSDDDNVFSCPLCDHVVPDADSMEMHIQEFHEVPASLGKSNKKDSDTQQEITKGDTLKGVNITEDIDDSESKEDPVKNKDNTNADDTLNEITKDSTLKVVNITEALDNVDARGDPDENKGITKEDNPLKEKAKGFNLENEIIDQIENNIFKDSKVEDKAKSPKEISGQEDSAGKIDEYAEEDEDDDDFGVEGDYIGDDDLSENEESDNENILKETIESSTTTPYQENIRDEQDINNVQNDIVDGIEDISKSVVNSDATQEIKSAKNNTNMKDVEPDWFVERRNIVSDVESVRQVSNVNKDKESNVKEISDGRETASPTFDHDDDGDDDGFTCPLCDYVVPDASSMEMHIQEFHEVPASLHIDEDNVDSSEKRKADESFEEPAMKRAMKEIKVENSMLNESIDGTGNTLDIGDEMEVLYGCHECDYVGSKPGLQVHSRKHKKEKQFKCDKCNYKCHSEQTLDVHKNKNHSHYACALCSFTSASASGIKVHVKTHNKPDKTNQITDYFCDQCKFTCINIEEMKAHYIDIHESPLKFIVSKVRNTTRKSTLGSKYECPEFESPMQESELKIKNNGIKKRRRRRVVAIPYMSGLPKSSIQSELNATSTEQEDSNDSEEDSSGEGKSTTPIASSGKTGNPNYQCKFCQYMSISRRGLSVHMKGVHGVTNEKLHYPKGTWIGTRQYACELCDYKASTSAQISMHFRTHIGERPWACMECGARFTHKTSLKIHEACHLEEKPFVCKYDGCHYATKLKLNIDSHHYKHRYEERKNKQTNVISQENY